jgi:hypothetical protein
MDVTTNVLIGPTAGKNSSGSIIRLTQKTPRGGIHAVFRIRETDRVDCARYSTQPLQNMVITRLSIGIITQPSSCERFGKKSASPKLQRVKITA